ncbi:MAG: hypothetical protein DME33_00655 [Verrucomicrobia bacterium]|nr:MAG: hypothetical protein DME33_00655 [Verrucomicrobiota bacterium]
MRRMFVILGCVFTTIPALAAEKEPIRIIDGWGVARLYGNVAARETYDAKAADAFEFIVEEVPAQELANQRASVKRWWGADGPKPPLLVKRISFKIGGLPSHFRYKHTKTLATCFIPRNCVWSSTMATCTFFYRPQMQRPATPRPLSYGMPSSSKGLWRQESSKKNVPCWSSATEV